MLVVRAVSKEKLAPSRAFAVLNPRPSGPSIRVLNNIALRDFFVRPAVGPSSRVVAMDYRPPSSPVAEAMNWVSRIISVALMTLLPILGGRWLDGKRGTSYWALIGLVVGLLVGSWQLLQIVREANKKQQSLKHRPTTSSSKRASAERRSDENDSDASPSGS